MKLKIKRIYDFVTEHHRSEGMTYIQHFVYALTIAARMLASAACLILHSVFPFICPPRGLDMESMRDFLNEKWSKRSNKSP